MKERGTFETCASSRNAEYQLFTDKVATGEISIPLDDINSAPLLITCDLINVRIQEFQAFNKQLMQSQTTCTHARRKHNSQSKCDKAGQPQNEADFNEQCQKLQKQQDVASNETNA